MILLSKDRNKIEEIQSKASLAKSPEEAMEIFRDAGIFMSIQCHGYAANNVNNSEKKPKKWWQFWK